MSPQELRQVFDDDGVVVVRDLVDRDTLRLWQKAWSDYYRSDRMVPFNPVAVDGPFPETLAAMPRYSPLLDVIEAVFGCDLALYNHRFVIKDAHARQAVFLHQDTPYHVGGARKASAFIALSPVDAHNGGMKFWLGTHRFGYLGDAGEIDPAVLPACNEAEWPTLQPALNPGDVVLMHSSSWHASSAHVEGCDRVMADIIYCPADDAGAIELLRGRWRTERRITPEMRSKLFVRSRASRLRDLQQQLDGRALAAQSGLSGGASGGNVSNAR